MTEKLDDSAKPNSKNNNLSAWIGGTLPLIIYGIIFVAVVVLVIFKFRGSIF